MIFVLVDMHFHIDSRWHKVEHLEQTLNDIKENRIIVAGQATDVPSYNELINIVKRSDYIFPAFGILPWYAHDVVPKLDSIDIPVNEVGMLGEIGLDYLYSPPEATPELQKALFEFFLQAAERHDMILNLHVRGASDDTLAILASYNVNRVILHSHTDSLESIKEATDRGYYITVNPVVLNPSDDGRRKIHTAIIKAIPEDFILSEVDTVPLDYEPPSKILRKLIDYMADLRKIKTDDLSSTIHANSLRLLKGAPTLNQYVKLLE